MYWQLLASLAYIKNMFAYTGIKFSIAASTRLLVVMLCLNKLKGVQKLAELPVLGQLDYNRFSFSVASYDFVSNVQTDRKTNKVKFSHLLLCPR